MSLENYFDITSLPNIGDLGDSAPVKLGEFVEYLRSNKVPGGIVKVLFLLDDLMQREAFLAGELSDDRISPAVLGVSQIKNEEPLPDYLVDSEGTPTKIEVDQLWDSFFRYAEELACQFRNSFLHNWVKYEVGLRNAIAEERARKLGLVPEDYFIATELGNAGIGFSGVINEWASQETPLEGMKVLLRSRWDWYTDNESWFTFGDDELAAYAAKLMLQVQWTRLTELDERKI